MSCPAHRACAAGHAGCSFVHCLASGPGGQHLQAWTRSGCVLCLVGLLCRFMSIRRVENSGINCCEAIKKYIRASAREGIARRVSSGHVPCVEGAPVPINGL
ncbi:unnamed protein product [Discosporangium mesarthrocarpum]